MRTPLFYWLFSLLHHPLLFRLMYPIELLRSANVLVLSIFAFTRTRNVGFLSLAFSALGLLFGDTIGFVYDRFDEVGVASDYPLVAHLVTFFPTLYTADTILLLIGIVLIVRAYLGLCRPGATVNPSPRAV